MHLLTFRPTRLARIAQKNRQENINSGLRRRDPFRQVPTSDRAARQ